jgi:phosphoenolpyruvate---glycerone phosphotransferase subunit DhaK
MKKFVNDPKQFVPEMLRGIALANPDTLRYVPEYNLIMRADAPRDDKVSIVQGSGSGHEPAHVMVVGRGMLDAACPGDVFAAPPMDYVYETTKLLNSPKGVLHLINNYTGDRMAFDMGREMADAEGIRVETLIIDDDVSVKDSTYTVGRRGVAGNFFVIKAVGAAAEEGAELDDLVTLGNRVNDVTRTMGMALTACTPPAKGSPLFELGADEMEMGVGIHGEPGRRREKLTNADAIIDELLEACVTDLPYQQGDEVALMINGLGGTPSASSTSSTAGPTSSSPNAASPCARTTSASTAPHSTWPAPPSPWSSSMTSWSGCWRLQRRSPSASSSSQVAGPIARPSTRRRAGPRWP